MLRLVVPGSWLYSGNRDHTSTAPRHPVHRGPWAGNGSVCPEKGVAGEERVEERGWAYRRRQPEGTVLYEAAKDCLSYKFILY